MSPMKRTADDRVERYRLAIQKLVQGDYKVDLNGNQVDELDCLGHEIKLLALVLEQDKRQQLAVEKLTLLVNAGLSLENVLDRIYEEFHDLLPYNRIGFSLLEEGGKTVRAHWARTDQPGIQITKGYSASLAGSSLQSILRTGRPRCFEQPG